MIHIKAFVQVKLIFFSLKRAQDNKITNRSGRWSLHPTSIDFNSLVYFQSNKVILVRID